MGGILDTQYFEINRELEKHFYLFQKFWDLGEPIWNTSIPTAEVRFNYDNESIEYHFNPAFWGRLSTYDKGFVISHEIMHLFLAHPKRIEALKGLVDSKAMQHGSKYKDPKFPRFNPQIANVAADLKVNHYLIDHYGFSREQLSIGDELCWYDAVLKEPFPSPDSTMEELYKLLLMDSQQQQDARSSFDSPGGWQSEKGGGDQTGTKKSSDEQVKQDEIIKKYLKKAYKDSAKEYAKQFENFCRRAGVEPSFSEFVVQLNQTKKRKWETVITNWAKTKVSDKDTEQWIRLNRRYAILDSDLILPTDAETEDLDKNKIEVWFFQDVSGSCVGYDQRFFNAAMSLPQDKFDVKLFCFDTQVRPVDPKRRKIIGGGGTSFQCIESYIQSCRQGSKNYPKAIFVITDGYGDTVIPQRPERWFWFLTHSYKSFIPAKSKTYMLKDFE